MPPARAHHLTGTRGTLAVREWSGDQRYLALVVHGYGEHTGRYAPLAEVLLRHGALVTGPDHMGTASRRASGC